MQTVGQLLNYSRRGFNSTVALVAKDQPKQWNRLAKSVSTEEQFYRVSQYSGYGQSSIVTEGAPFPQDSRVVAGSIDVYPFMWGNGFGYTAQAKAADFYNLISKSAADIAKGHMDTKEMIVANIFNRAFNSSYTGPDSLELCSTSHTAATGALGGNTQSNYGDGSASLALSTANVETMIVQMRKRKDHRGLRSPIREKLRLCVPPDLEPLAYRICKSTAIQGSANNDVNYIRAGSASLEPETFYQFTSTTAFFILPQSLDALQTYVLNRIPLRTESDYDKRNWTFFYNLGEEIATYWEDWRAVQGSPGT